MANLAWDYAGMEERRLVALATVGDRQAFHAIMKRCNQPLFRVARAVVGSDEEAEDVLQAAYLAAFRNVAGFRGDAKILTWLTAITLNEARGRLRKRRPTLEADMLDRLSSQVVPFPGAAPVLDPEAEAERMQVRMMLETAIDGLPSHYRLVFILCEIEGFTIEQAGLQLGIPPATVKTRNFRAKRMLRASLQKRLTAGLDDVFPFLGARCERICERVLDRLV